jgi:hypothetical protein
MLLLMTSCAGRQITIEPRMPHQVKPNTRVTILVDTAEGTYEHTWIVPEDTWIKQR